MPSIIETIKNISSEKRAILEKKLKEDGSKYGVFPLSFSQQRLWFLDRFESNSAVYNIPGAFRILGRLDINALKESINRVIERHEILRTIFITLDKEPFQLVNKELKLDLPITDLQYLTGDVLKKEINKIIDIESKYSFDLSKGPLVRVKLIKISNEEHIFTFTMHHIISDGWSMGVVIKEVAAIYNAIVNGHPDILPPLNIQYGDFAKWQQKYFKENKYKKQLEYWKNKLSDASPVLELPYDKPRPAHQTYNGTRIEFFLEKELTDKLNNICLEYDITLFMLLLASFQTLLFRYSSQNDVSVGFPIAGRNRAETESLIGFFINTLVLNTDFSDNTSFTTLLKQVKENVLSAFDNQDLPLEKIVDTIQPERDLSIPPLFQVLFTFQNLPIKKFKMSDLVFEAISTDTDTVKFDLTLSLEDRKGVIHGNFGYNQDLFNPETIHRFVDSFKLMIEKIIEAPDTPVALLPIIKEEEKNKLLVEWNNTKRDFNLSKGIHQYFEEQVAKTPNNIAVEENKDTNNFSSSITYKELSELSNSLANYLSRKGINKGDIVAVCLERSTKMIVSLLGILKCGCSYLPIDTKYPSDRIKFMLSDSKASIVLTESHLQEKFNGFSDKIIDLEELWPKILDESTSYIGPEFNEDDPAYIIYTSGSTGKPKGVIVEHKNAVNYINVAKEQFVLTENDKVLQFASISFDAAVEEIYPCLISGATLCLRNELMISSAATFVNTIKEWGISILDLPTAYWHQLVTEIINNNQKFHKALRLIIIGGERAIPEQVLEWQKHFGNKIRLLNTYGPTEATVVATIWELPNDRNKQPFLREVPIGKPIANAQVYVVDQSMNIVPVGVPGELCISGAGITRGYLNRPELTRKFFIANPFYGDKNSRLYKTGDRVRYLSDGSLEYLGRMDHQVKIRGFRIELGEIENELRNIPEIKDAVVWTHERSNGDKILTAYYLLEDDKDFNIANVKNQLKNQLPDYMVPAYFIKLDEIPLSESGKINYKKLPVPNSERPEMEKIFVPPTDPLEILLSGILQNILEIDKIGIHDNFFELGGDSLKAAIFINRLQNELNEILYVVVLFDNPTIYKLAEYLKTKYPQGVVKFCRKDYPDYKLNNKTKSTYEIAEPVNSDMIKHAVEILSARNKDIELEENFLSTSKDKLSRGIFVLSAPRSGSTLLRVILAGNSKLFSPPELALLNFSSLKERKEKYKGRDEGWMEGLLRAIMELKECDFEEAKIIMSKFEEENLSAFEMYEKLQSFSNGRILVDKTTTYATDERILNKAEKYFNDAFYIHIVRHPASMIQSYIDSSLDQVFGSDLPFKIRQKAELFWIINNSNVVKFFNSIPENRKCIIKFEDLVTEPEKVIKSLCEKLNINYEPFMLKPYEGEKMRDGVHHESRMVGDPRFNQHKNIDAKMASKWKTLSEGDYLCNHTIRLAEIFGYSIQENSNSDISILRHVPRDNNLRLSFAQERLWFLDKLEPDNSAYNIPGVVKLKGYINIDVLKHTIHTIIERHEILRSYIETVDGTGLIRISDQVMPNIAVENISNHNGINLGTKIKMLVQQEIRKPFVLSKAPLFRIKLFKISENEHIFTLTMHHIISDGWSVGVFIKEFSAIYSALLNNVKPKLPELTVQYIDYASWQREYLSGEILDEQLNFWKKYLEGVPPLLELPTDKPRPAVQTFTGNIKEFTIPNSLSEKINKYCKDSNVTPFMFLLTVFQILLSKYSRQNDICTGVPVANRNRTNFENLIGLFVNTIVVRNQINPNEKFSDLIKKVKESAVSAFAHQEIPFEKIVDYLDVERNVSHSPLFQVMFTYQNLPKSKIELPGLELESVDLESNISKFDLSLTMMDGDNGFTGGFEYNTDLFEESTIGRIIEHFQSILSEVVKNPLLKVNDINLISEKEKCILLEDWNAAEYSYDDESTLPKMFEKAVEKYENNIAVNYNNQKLTYSELNHRANCLANHLIEKGVTQDSMVGFYFDRSIESIISIIAVWKAGAAYIPLDPSYPEERIEYMIIDSGITNIITWDKYKEVFREKNLNVVLLDTEEISNSVNGENPNINIHPDNLAYIIYTSGSTGKPKGVMIRHKSVLNLAAELMNNIYNNYDANSLRISLNAPLAFDASVQQLIALLFGHQLFIIPQETRLDSENLLNFIINNKLDVLDCVPTQLRILLDEGFAGEGKYRPSAVLPGGEPIDNKMWNELVQIKDVDFFNMYGPTECTVDSTICNINNTLTKPSIGKPVNNVTHFVLDSNLELLPVGIPGELYIGGNGLARGYLNRPELTAEKFVPNPFSKIGGERLYRTGDLVRYLSDGNLEYIGRIDSQVKLRGFRIELGEIESTLNSHKDIEQSVVVVREYNSNIKKLVAYIVTNNSALKNEDLEKYLSETLPEYMIPSFFVKLDTIPLTPNGKIDRRALPEPTQNDVISNEEYVMPGSEREEILAQIWQDLLGIDKVGIHDNFFKLGGDSIVGIQMISKAKQKGLQISPVQIFQHQTIHKLAAVATKAKSIRAEQGIISGKFDLIPIQEMFLENNFENRNHWNQSLLFKVSKNLEEGILLQTVKAISMHHDALRIRLTEDIKTGLEIIPEFDNRTFEYVDLSNDKNSLRNIIESKCNEAQQSLNIVDGPLFKIIYFSINENEGRLLFVFHHIAIDGVSWRILLEDFQILYKSFENNIEYKLPPKTTSVKEWSEALKNYSNSELIKKEEKYWLDNAEMYKKNFLPKLRDGINDEKSANSISAALDEEMTNKLLKEVNEKYNTKIDDILLTALLLSYSQWSGKRSMYLNLEGHGRNHISDDIDLSRTIGWFTTIYPLSLDLSKAISVEDSVKIVKEQIRSIPNEGIGYGILRYLSEEQNIKDKLSIFDTIGITFNYLGQFDNILNKDSIFQPAEENKGPERALNNKRSSIIDISGSVFDNRLRINFSFSKNLFEESNIKEWSELYLLKLKEIITVFTGNSETSFTSSDFELTNLNNKKLNKVLSKLKKK